MRPRIKGEQARRIVTLYSQGKTATEIGSLERIRPSTVCRVLRREGAQVRKPGRNPNALSLVVCEAILRQYSENEMTTKAIARLHEIHPVTVQKVVRRMGGIIRKPGRKSKWAGNTASTSVADPTGSGPRDSATRATTT